MIFDRTCRGARLRPGLSHAWWAGAWLYRGLGRFDAWTGAASWRDALDWLAGVEPAAEIGEVQFWGHGKWGRALIGAESLDVGALAAAHPLAPQLAAVRERMSSNGLWWFRTCETIGADAGHDFARRWSDYFGGRVAGHTFVIGAWQSGLHTLAAGARPTWAADEGLAEGSAAAPQRAHDSGPRRPHTVTCLHGAVPRGY